MRGQIFPGIALQQDFHRRARGYAVSLLSCCVALTSLAATASAVQAPILTHHSNTARTGTYSAETLLTPANINSKRFGKLYSYPMDGYVAAQPLYVPGVAIPGIGVRNVLYVATMHDSVYALDADRNGPPLWQASFLDPANGVTTVPIAEQGCPNVTRFTEGGILATPVIDTTANAIYFTVKTKEVAGSSTNYVFRLHALDLTTGAEKAGSPVLISSTALGPFSPKQYQQRPGLAISNGNVIVAFGSNGCDFNAQGWVFAFDATTLEQQAVFQTQPNQPYGASVWQAGFGLAVDDDGFIYFSTANGTFDANLGGPNYGDSIIKLRLNRAGFSVRDYFTPFDQQAMQLNDLDLGSGGVVVLPDQPAPHAHLLVTAGKGGTIYLLDRDNLGGYNGVDDSQIVQSIPGALDEVHGGPIFWNNTLYYAAEHDALKAFSFSNGLFSPTPVLHTPLAYWNLGTPVISANGNTNGILWTARNPATPTLAAFDAAIMKELYNTQQNAARDQLGPIPHFVSPVVVNGRVYMGTQTQVLVYGLLPTLSIASGNNQSAAVATQVTLAAQVADPYGGVTPGVTVAFTDNGRGGSFASTSVITDGNGMATATYTMPTKSGAITINASATGYPALVFKLTANPGPAVGFGVVSGGGQTAPAGTQLPIALVLKIKDAYLNGVPGQTVTLTDSGAGGSLSPPSPVLTGNNGLVTIYYTLPTTPKKVVITTVGAGITFKLNETGATGPAANVNLISGDGQMAAAGTQLPAALVVGVTDPFGNPVSGATVQFSDNGAGGGFSSSSVITDSNGQASATYTLPGTAGTYPVTATVGALTPASFSETAQ
jgi:hypothetical protein